jgi:hypothetical protein
LYKEVKTYVQQCEVCQHRATDRVDEALMSTVPPGLFEKVHINITEMPSDSGRKHLVIACCDFSWWPEARALGDKSSEGVAKFLWEDIICQHRLFRDLVVDRGSENMKDVITLLNKIGANRIQILPYNSRANGTIERGHCTILAALLKMTNGGLKHW